MIKSVIQDVLQLCKLVLKAPNTMLKICIN